VVSLRVRVQNRVFAVAMPVWFF